MITTILYMCVCGSGKPNVMGTKCSSKMAISEILFLVGDFFFYEKKNIIFVRVGLGVGLV